MLKRSLVACALALAASPALAETHALIMTISMSLIVSGAVNVYARMNIAGGTRVPPEISWLGGQDLLGFLPLERHQIRHESFRGAVSLDPGGECVSGFHLARGQADGGRYLQVVYIFDPEDVVYVIHARPLTAREKRRFRRRRR